MKQSSLDDSDFWFYLTGGACKSERPLIFWLPQGSMEERADPSSPCSPIRIPRSKKGQGIDKATAAATAATAAAGTVAEIGTAWQ